LDPKHYLALLGLARLHAFQQKYKEAEELYVVLGKLYPKDVSAVISLGNIYFQQSNLAKAEEFLRKAIQLDRGSAAAHYHLAITLLREKKTHDAISYLKVAARLEEKSPAIHQALGVAYVVTGNLHRAERAFRTALTLSPRMPEAVHALGDILIRTQRPQDAIEILVPYVDRKGNDFIAREILAHAYYCAKKYRHSRDEMAFVFSSLNPTDTSTALARSRLLNNIGVCLAFENQPLESEKILLESLAASPRVNKSPYINLGVNYLRRQDFARAHKILTEGLSIFPKDATIHSTMALAFRGMGNYEGAIRELEATIECDGTRAMAYGDLGWALTEAAKDYDKALAVLKEGYHRFPTNYLVVNNLAYTHLMRGDVREAREILESFKSPDENGLLSATWGLLHLWEGRVDSAKDYYTQAASLARSRGNRLLAQAVKQKMHLELARFFIRQQNKESAQHEISQALAIKDTGEYGRLYTRDLLALQQDLSTGKGL